MSSSVGIYRITSPVGAIYIGQSWNIEKRINVDYRNKGLCNHSRKLYNSLKEFGVDAHRFDIVYELPKDITQDILDSYEKFYMAQYLEVYVSLLNIRNAGSRGKHSHETIARMKGVLGKWMIGRKLSDETKKKMSDSRINKPKPKRTNEHSLNISISNKGKHDSPTVTVIQYDLTGVKIKEWGSIREAAFNTGQKSCSNIVSCCKKVGRLSAGGFKWSYKI